MNTRGADMDMNKEFLLWSKRMEDYHFPRWDELPDFTIYMDQVISLVEKYLSFLSDDEKVITPSMVNNYVKLNLIPKPDKKRYAKVHIAYLIAITVLKQVLPIVEVRDGIEMQTIISGLKGAYDLFCDEQEKALKEVAQVMKKGKNQVQIIDIYEENTAMKMATLAFATKLAAQKIVHVKNEVKREEYAHE